MTVISGLTRTSQIRNLSSGPRNGTRKETITHRIAAMFVLKAALGSLSVVSLDPQHDPIKQGLSPPI